MTTDGHDVTGRAIFSFQKLSQPARPKSSLGDEPRKLIAIRLDAKVWGWLRKTAEKKGLAYQTLVNEILAREICKAT